VRQAFIGQAAPNFWFFIVTYLTGLMFWNKYRCVAVTSEAIYILDSTKWSGGRETPGIGGADAEEDPARPGVWPLGRGRSTR
jgi:hypothetical protein